jgi:hypothetical protein
MSLRMASNRSRSTASTADSPSYRTSTSYPSAESVRAREQLVVVDEEDSRSNGGVDVWRGHGVLPEAGHGRLALPLALEDAARRSRPLKA